MKYWLKKCPRCSGDLREEANTFETFIACLQCGHTLTRLEETVLVTSGVIERPAREEEPQHEVPPRRRRRQVA